MAVQAEPALPDMRHPRQAPPPARIVGPAMIEYLRYLSGDWRATCTVCQRTIETDTVLDVWQRGRAHEQVCR